MKKNILYLAFSILLYSCAQFVPPTGGDRDKTPPKLLKSIPEQKQRNYQSREIYLEFDELIDVGSIQQELIVVPSLEGSFTIKNKNNTLKLILENKLKDSTTYTFNFREGIKDLNERNPSKNLKLVFSTNQNLDTLGLTGNVKNIYTAEPIKDVLVGLYKINKKDSLAYYKRKPDYFVSSDSAGNYNFENIKSDTYKIIAIDDKNTNLVWDKKTESIGFLTDSIYLNKNSSGNNLNIYKADNSPIKIKRAIARETNFSIIFDKPIKELTIDPYIEHTLRNQTELLLFNYNAKYNTDTTIVNIYTKDSLNRDSTFKQKIYFQKLNTTKKQKQEVLSIKANYKQNEELVNPIRYTFDFDYPIDLIDTSKIKLRKDTLSSENYTLKAINQSKTKFELVVNNSTLKGKINLIIEPAAFTNIKKDTNNTFFLTNQILEKSDLGLIEGSLKDTSGIKIVELYNVDKARIEKSVITKDKFIFNDLIQGNYQLKVIYDKNNNGIWDPGNVDINTKHEDIHIHKTIFRIKSNFELRDIRI